MLPSLVPAWEPEFGPSTSTNVIVEADDNRIGMKDHYKTKSVSG